MWRTLVRLLINMHIQILQHLLMFTLSNNPWSINTKWCKPIWVLCFILSWGQSESQVGINFKQKKTCVFKRCTVIINLQQYWDAAVEMCVSVPASPVIPLFLLIQVCRFCTRCCRMLPRRKQRLRVSTRRTSVISYNTSSPWSQTHHILPVSSHTVSSGDTEPSRSTEHTQIRTSWKDDVI